MSINLLEAFAVITSLAYVLIHIAIQFQVKPAVKK